MVFTDERHMNEDIQLLIHELFDLFEQIFWSS